MMTPRLASWSLSLESYCRNVYRTTVEKYQRLPVQWRGFVLHNQHHGHTVDAILAQIERGNCTARYEPQAAFDAFQGQCPQ